MTDAISRTRHEPPTFDNDRSDTPTPATALRAANDRAYEEALDRLSLPAPVVLHGIAPPDGSPAVIQARLDAFMQTTAGPYRAEGQTTFAAAQFRMNGGFNQLMTPAQEWSIAHPVGRDGQRRGPDAAELAALALLKRLPANLRERDGIVAKAKLNAALGAVSAGRGTPEQLQRITQALIDGGRLPPPAKDALADRIRQMQWDHSTGLDCAGYVYRAFLAARPHSTPAQYGLKSPENENFTGLATNPHFRKVDATEARPGDLFTLAAPRHGEPGHNAIVYSHDVLSDASARDALSATRPGDTTFDVFLNAGGSVHVLEVDSSWGAGPAGAPSGGVRRETWLYCEGSKQWAALQHGATPLATDPFLVFDVGHIHKDPIGGVFRPKGE